MRLIYIVSFFLVWGLVGCQDDADRDEPESPKPRTLLVYFGMDNNFWPEAQEKIDSMVAGWGNYDGNLLVYVDARGSRPRLIRISQNEQGQNRAEDVQVYENENSADPVVLNRVVSEVVRKYPAESYGMIVLSHASGWLPAKTLGAARSVIIDGTSEMEMRDFAAALPVKLDFIVFDACFMGSIEVAYEFRDKADYLLVSPAEILVRPGFSYKKMVGQLMKPEADLLGVASDVYNRFVANEWPYLTLSLVKTSELDKLADFCAPLLRGVDGEKLVNINQLQNFGFGRQLLFFDFGDYMKALAPDRYQEFDQLLSNCLPYKKATAYYYSDATGVRSVNTYSGLAVYIPQAAYPFLNSEYQKLKWTQRIQN